MELLRRHEEVVGGLRWMDGIKFLMGLDAGRTLSDHDQVELLALRTTLRKDNEVMSFEIAAEALRDDHLWRRGS